MALLRYEAAEQPGGLWLGRQRGAGSGPDGGALQGPVYAAAVAVLVAQRAELSDYAYRNECRRVAAFCVTEGRRLAQQERESEGRRLAQQERERQGR